MVHVPEYSLVIRPPSDIIEHVAQLKKQLRSEIGWFGSANAQAHLTVFNFDATPDELIIWNKNIRQFCSTIAQRNVVFDHFDAFVPRTFFIAPNEDSTIYLNNIIAGFSRLIGEKPQAHAHISVARNLKNGQLAQARGLFEHTSVHFEFACEGLTLRRFDYELKQYLHIMEKFPFEQ